MWDWFFAYGTLVVGAFATAGVLYKEADEYINVSKKRGAILLGSMYLFTLFLLIAGIYQTHETRAQAYADKQQAGRDRERLNEDRIQAKQDRAVNKALLDDAKTDLHTLQNEVGKLQTKAETQQLSKELVEVNKKLAEAESKLQQPRARFAATFSTPYYDKIPIRETAGERVPEGVKFSFGVMNQSEVAAVQGMVVIRLCDACQFANEPTGFERPSNSPDTERVRNFPQIQEHSVLQDMSATVIPPFGASQFQFGVMVKCQTCDHAEFQVLTVDMPPILPPSFEKRPAKPRPGTFKP